MSAPIFNRAEEKSRARACDEERLRQGEISPQDLQRENLLFRGFRKDVIGFEIVNNHVRGIPIVTPSTFHNPT